MEMIRWCTLGHRGQEISLTELLTSIEVVFRDMHSWDQNNRKRPAIVRRFGY
jgi:DNA-binding HxlR family transcriptional regulator